jgi:hypothetical protein
MKHYVQRQKKIMAPIMPKQRERCLTKNMQLYD